MKLKNYLRRNAAIVFAISLLAVGTTAQDKKDDKKATPDGKPVLWEEVNVKMQDLYLGTEGEAGKPDVSSITFVAEETGGHSKKYKIKDAAGKTWVAKVGDEAQSETAAVRLLSALGYQTETVYLFPELTIPGKGKFTNVRLEARPDNEKRLGTWSWKSNPFQGTKEFQGLKIMMAFLSNWDSKEANNVLLKDDDRVRYAISDLGVSFGKSGAVGIPIFWRIGRTRNTPDAYAEADFVKGVKSGEIKFAFVGKNDPIFDDITKADGRWLADLLVQLSDKQIEDAFRAANYSAADIATLSDGVKRRIRALDLATSPD